MSLSLVILAAGMGSRYGGLKQLDAVGPSGETMLDFAVFDAVRAGFDRMVFIIRREFEAEFDAMISRRYAGAVRVETVFQSMDDLPAGSAAAPGRVRPWGTGHALWCARAAVDGPFAVINADDFYGRDSFERLAEFLRAPAPDAGACFGIVGFQLARTLSENGTVSRGVCTAGSDGLLASVVEHTGIRHEDVGPGRTFSGEEIVSMNCWALTPAVFPPLERLFAGFLRDHGAEPKAEFHLPAAISSMIAAGETRVRVLPTKARWFGVTYREDKPGVMEAIRQLVSEGGYPAPLKVSNASRVS
ncbi:MAG: nucleotidyltransferase family protein [Opitutaceae bacterium]